jgi:hypothetical protein
MILADIFIDYEPVNDRATLFAGHQDIQIAHCLLVATVAAGYHQILYSFPFFRYA